MENNSTIYLVRVPGCKGFCCVSGIFDSKKKAKEFINRFKTKQDLEIVELESNTPFSGDKSRDPYLVTFLGASITPVAVSICQSISDIEDAFNEVCEIDRISDHLKQARFDIKILATSRKEAIKKAISIRDAEIHSGRWKNEPNMLDKIKNLLIDPSKFQNDESFSKDVN